MPNCVKEELKSMRKVALPEEVDGMSKDDAIEEMAEMALNSEIEEYGDILGNDRDQVKDAVIRDLEEFHEQDGAEDPRIRLARLLEL